MPDRSLTNALPPPSWRPHVARKLANLVCAGVIVGLTTLLPVACSKDDSGTNPTNAVITVSGKVVGYGGRAVASVPVVIGTLPTVTTDANGNFSIANVTVPYNITAVNPSSNTALVYTGLTRTDPTLTFIDLYLGFPSSATVSGTVTGGETYPQPLSHFLGVSFISPECDWTVLMNGPSSGLFSLKPSWNGPVTTSGIIHALAWQTDATTVLPISYKGYGTRTGVALSNGGTFSAQNVVVSPIATTNFSGAVSAQAGYVLSNRYVDMVFGTAGMQIISDATIPSTPTSTTFNYLMPNITGATLTLSAVATKGLITVSGFKKGFAINASGVTLALPAGPEYTLPVTAATGVTTATTFSWTAMANAVYLIQFTGPAGKPRYQIVTSATTATIPNLTSLGLGLPANASYIWTIRSFAPFGSIDAAASANVGLGLLTISGATEGYAVDTGSGSPRTFITAP
jgi:hypothetical protein